MSVPLGKCPGAANIRGTPTLAEKICPECGRIIEIFSIETQAQCKCGFIAFQDLLSCVSWCKYARECVGDEAYERYVGGSRFRSLEVVLGGLNGVCIVDRRF